jgi:hypothetical protein
MRKLDLFGQHMVAGQNPNAVLSLKLSDLRDFARERMACDGIDTRVKLDGMISRSVYPLKDSAAVWVLIDTVPATKDIINGYIHHRAKNYDHAEKIKGAVKNNVVEWSKDLNVLPALLAPLPRRGSAFWVLKRLSSRR